MKTKKLKKISKFLSKGVYREVERRRLKEDYSIGLEDNANFKLTASEFDENLSSNLDIFITNLLRLDDINLEIKDEKISIFVDISKFKRNKNLNQTNSEESLEIIVTKLGIKIRKNYNSSLFYSDDKIFNRLLPNLIKRNSEITKVKIQNIIDETSIETNILRNANLDKLMNSI